MKTWSKSKRTLRLISTLIFIVGAICLLFCGCTIRPKQPIRKQASFGSDGKQDSGFKGFVTITNNNPQTIYSVGKELSQTQTNVQVERWGIITAETKENYDRLTRKYGNKFSPPMIIGFGLSNLNNGTWLINKKALVRFETMSRWERTPRRDWNRIIRIAAGITFVILISILAFKAHKIR